MAPLLAPLGFSRAAYTWNRLRFDRVDVVSLQSIGRPSPGIVSVALNVGIAVPRILRDLHGTYPVVWTEAHCLVSFRLGEETASADHPRREMLWWDVSDSSLPRVAAIVQRRLQDAALGWFSSVSSWEDLAESFEAGSDWRSTVPAIQVGRAMLLAAVGRVESASALLSKLPADWARERQIVEKWIRRGKLDDESRIP